MPADISKVFKASVKAVRMSLEDSQEKNDLLNEELLGKKRKTEQQTKSKNPAEKLTSSIAKELRAIIQNISILKEFLTENKKAYIQPNYLLNQADGTDWQMYENQAEAIIKKCADAIRGAKEAAFGAGDSGVEIPGQNKVHLENVFFLVEKYLKDVCKIYTEQKAIRVKRVVEKKNMSQLCSRDLKDSKMNLLYQASEVVESSVSGQAGPVDNELIGLSEQELLTLESENDLLYDDLTSQMQEVKRIESEVIEVSKLTQIFAENIVSQLSSIETIHKSAIETNSNLTLGNENIKEAMKKNAALRLWILFIIVVLAFTLLFLDWYND